ncbi:NUDIX domain-containing protein [Verrucosispora sp. WMMA2121]|uniref:NUDIX domain-containing protein n=1 Tax=Verrucosispora sp. WMMA2121 TaxID=3015164 RepID=UPI0022B6051F|nr:NUDIX domain-containing protein [Verrucosispora sp. WMMA2121]MCZ7422959.1 NUDIX domain-containing protein [Verrucosispora sp. WMMA2121]
MANTARHTVILRTLIFVLRGDEVLLIRYQSGDGDTAGEKSERVGIHNGIGGHVEAGEDILASATREAMEEAGVKLEAPRIAGVMHIDGFAGKQILNFVVVASTHDEPISECDEGALDWVNIDHLDKLHTFSDLKPLLRHSLASESIFTGTARFDGFNLLEMRIDGRPVALDGD